MAVDVLPEKTLPQNLDAERAVLGAILLDNALLDQAAEILTSEDFFLEGHRRIFSTMARLSAASHAIDSLTLIEELQRESVLEATGGVSYVASLLDGVPRLSNLEHYARIVKEKALLRRLVHFANEIVTRGLSNEENAAELLEAAERSIFEISQQKSTRGFSQLQDLLPATYQHIESLYHRKELITGIASGFIELDRLTCGLQKSDLIIVAARPGLGKTSLALNIAQHAATRGKKTVGFFSLEMSSNQLVTRLLCAEARVDGHKVRSGFLSKEDWSKLARAMSTLAQASIFIDDTPGISMGEMRSKARRLKAEHGLDLLMVDYLQLMAASVLGTRTRYENRQQEIAAISRGLKALAKELNIPVVAISQLSRAPEQRRGEDHKPKLSDLRESGSIEQDADVVLFIYREDQYHKEEDPSEDSGVAQIIIAKQRNGPAGYTVKLAFIDQWTKFENLSAGHE
ncbi:MAG: replicative DNA helicase [Acidobacteria bacterium]|nr:replicative DNA helicase [Acidobacteriota bacterium]